MPSAAKSLSKDRNRMKLEVYAPPDHHWTAPPQTGRSFISRRAKAFDAAVDICGRSVILLAIKLTLMELHQQ